MTKEKVKFVLNQIVPLEESLRCEFKSVRVNPVPVIREQVGRYVVAYLNGGIEGSIYWGITDDRQAIGVSLDSRERDDFRKDIVAELRSVTPAIIPTSYDIIFHPLFAGNKAEIPMPDQCIIEVKVERVSPRQVHFIPGTKGEQAFIKTNSGIEEAKGKRLVELQKSTQVEQGNEKEQEGTSPASETPPVKKSKAPATPIPLDNPYNPAVIATENMFKGREDDLKGIIETLQRRIGRHRDYLSENETRTRQMLIDPLLYALGWDVLDPDTVQLEYKVKQKRADYVLMWNGKPVAVIEAKRLGSSLEDNETTQVHIYANQNGIPYMIVTDGDKWEMYEVFKPVPLEERRLMKFELSQQLTHESMLRIWKPNLATGNPSEAMEPVVVLSQPGPDLTSSSPNESQPSSNDPPKNSTLTLTQRLYLDYWTAFGEYLEQRNGVMKPRAPQPDQWIGAFTFKKTGGCTLYLTINKTDSWIRVAVYTPGKRGEAYFHLLAQDKTKIEAEVGNKLKWENKEENTTDRFISLYLYGVDLENRQDWDRQHKWICKQLETFHRVFSPRFQVFNASD